MDKKTAEAIAVIKNIRDTCDALIAGIRCDNDNKTEKALGRFLALMAKNAKVCRE